MKKKIILGIAIFAIVLLFSFYLRSQYTTSSKTENQDKLETIQKESSEFISANPSPSATQSDPQPTPSAEANTNIISISELSKHNTISDCWISDDNKVYDITSYLPRHPGSSGAIEPYCGSATEFEQAFTKKHGTSKVSLLMKVGTFIGDFDIVGELNK